MNFSDSGYGPVPDFHRLISHEDNVTWFEPLAALGYGGKVGGRPLLPQVGLESTDEIPSYQMAGGLVDGSFAGSAQRGLPIRKCPAVRKDNSSASSMWMGANDLEFSMASASVRTE